MIKNTGWRKFRVSGRVKSFYPYPRFFTGLTVIDNFKGHIVGSFTHPWRRVFANRFFDFTKERYKK